MTINRRTMAQKEQKMEATTRRKKRRSQRRTKMRRRRRRRRNRRMMTMMTLDQGKKKRKRRRRRTKKRRRRRRIRTQMKTQKMTRARVRLTILTFPPGSMRALRPKSKSRPWRTRGPGLSWKRKRRRRPSGTLR